MTTDELFAETLTYLDVDGQRRGIATLRESFFKAAMADLAAYIDEYNTGKFGYEPDEETPFGDEAAEALAEYMKARIARNIDRDLQLSQTHNASYLNLRRRLWVRIKEDRYVELRPWIGQAFVKILTIRSVNHTPLILHRQIWLTVKERRTDPDECAIIAVKNGAGIEVLNNGPVARIRVTFTRAQTAQLTNLLEYWWDLGFEGMDDLESTPKYGKVRARLPVTHTFAPTMTMIGDPDDAITLIGPPDNVPITFIP